MTYPDHSVTFTKEETARINAYVESIDPGGSRRHQMAFGTYGRNVPRDPEKRRKIPKFNPEKARQWIQLWQLRMADALRFQ